MPAPSRVVVCLTGLLLALTACDTGGGPAAGPDTDGRDTVAADSGGPDAAIEPDVPVVCDRQWYDLTFDEAGPIEVANGTARDVVVRVTDHGTGAPAPGVTVRVGLSGPIGGTSTLDAATVATGADGTAAVEFRADEAAPPVSWLLIASATCSADASVEIDVVAGDSGSLRVELAYDGTQPLVEVQVGLLAGGLTCATMDPDVPAASALLVVPSLQPVVFRSLPADSRFSVFAIGRGEGGGRVALGCRDDAYVEAGMENVVLVQLYDLVLDAAGGFDSTFALDLSGLATAPGLAAVDAFAARVQGADYADDLARRLRAGVTGDAAALDAFESAVRSAPSSTSTTFTAMPIPRGSALASIPRRKRLVASASSRACRALRSASSACR